MDDRGTRNLETITQQGPAFPRGSVGRPVLLLLGSAAEGGGLAGEDRFVLFEHTIEIGRRPQSGPDAQVCCLQDARVSSRHARVSRRGPDTFEVVDLASKNGTLVEGRSITGSTIVEDGALLLLGGQALLVCLVSEDDIAAMKEDRERPFGPVATLSPTMAAAIHHLRRLAPAQAPILLSGETGVGKEVYARAVHRASGRTGRFIALNCAAIPMDLMESELFGFLRGAHSQAAASKPGLVEDAEHGTLFLDEIGDMPVAAQAKLLRFLQDHEYVPLGGREARRMDVRVLAATSTLTPNEHSHGLRPDLVARFGACPVVLPPLRERRADVGSLTRHFLGPGHPLEVGAFLALLRYDWPHNVRELESVLRAAALKSEGKPEIGMVDLPRVVRACAAVGKAQERPRRRPPRTRLAKAEIEELLVRHKGNVAEVARHLDRQWAVVWRWIVSSGIDIEEYRRQP